MTATVPTIPGRWCYTDGSWKENDRYSGQGWYNTLEGFDSLLGARNTRVSQSPLHSEIEALIWGMEYIKTIHGYFCDRLFSIGEDGF